MFAATAVQELWFEVLFIRSKTMPFVKGRISGVFKALLLYMFFNSERHDFAKSGINIELQSGQRVHLFLHVRIVIADEAALHSLFGCKGASGLKCCLLCQNIFNYNEARGIVDADVASFAQHHVCSDASKFVLHTPGTISAVVRRLRAAQVEMSKAAFAELQTKLGWSFVDGGVMFHDRCRELVEPTRVAMYDWMHVFFVSGVFNVHVAKLMETLKPCKITYEMLHQYMSEWHFPVVLQGKIGAADGPFSARRAKSTWDAGTLKATAAECLCILPVLANFLHQLVTTAANATVREHAACFLVLASVFELIWKSSRHKIDADRLQSLSGKFMVEFRRLYGPEAMTIKFHEMMHFPAFLRTWSYIPNCFVLERKHKHAKRFANEVRNTNGPWEAVVARDITARHLESLQSSTTTTAAALLEPLKRPSTTMLDTLQAEFPLMLEPSEIKIARVARINEFEKIAVGDTVLYWRDGRCLVGKVLMLAVLEVETCPVSLVAAYELLEPATKRSAKYKRTDVRFLVAIDAVYCALIWAGSGDTITVLRPLHLDVPLFG